ncbi:hypothetical protein [uncultured Oxalicibacterium sp.]|uniref:hypothetical protein n=1 Tax=uncultured Oxalicibacterium sp. TaxID=1168540 RepID=UPI0025F5891C|nr:hypothetical protein [uncultured Oxalicibacterium sp.]
MFPAIKLAAVWRLHSAILPRDCAFYQKSISACLAPSQSLAEEFGRQDEAHQPAGKRRKQMPPKSAADTDITIHEFPEDI